MDFLNYLNSLSQDQQIDLALRCETTIGYLKQIAYGNKNCGAALAINIDRETQGAIAAEKLCPAADWQYIRSAINS